MGKGKGNLECWVAVVKPGRVMFEISGVPEETAREALWWTHFRVERKNLKF